MRHSLRIFTAAIAALAAILGLVALTLSGGAFSARAEGGKQTADAAFSYIYGMPVTTVRYLTFIRTEAFLRSVGR